MDSQKGGSAYQDGASPIDHRESTLSPPPPYRPALPPRHSDRLSPSDLPQKQLFYSQSTTLSWLEQDPRNASTESLVPPGNPRGKRTLLLIYIHGFLGDETSFQSFPAHVHNVVTGSLQDTHVVHTKIYPKYRSRKSIQYVRDDFSKWLSPHESPDTDVILCGHSMGGLLSAEVALMPNPYPQSPNALLHRLVGTINFDVPFLGMHPGVVASGISSLFRPTPKSPEATTPNPMDQLSVSPSTTTLSTLTTQNSQPQSLQTTTSSQSTAPTTLSATSEDPNYNPRFENDVNLPVRKGWESTLHFITKHSDHLMRASKSYVTSHLEFGGAMADYKGLQARYKALRALADPSRRQRPSGNSSRPPDLVRFINYYTASTGIPKPEREGKSSPLGRRSPVQSTASLEQLSTASLSQSQSMNHEGSPNETRQPDDVSILRPSPSHSRAGSSAKGDLISAEPIPEQAETIGTQESEHTDTSTALNDTDTNASVEHQRESITSPSYQTDLPPLPILPERPSDFDPAQFTDKDLRKLAEKDHDRQMKAYNRALKDREKAVKERSKILEKREKAAQKELEKQAKEAKKEIAREEKEKEQQREKASASSSQLAGSDAHGEAAGGEEAPSPGNNAKQDKKKKDRKFCMLPSKNRDGTRDPMWERVFMVNVDEVGAHCGLFMAERPHYEGLVHDVGELVEKWVREANDERVAHENVTPISLVG